MRNGSRARTDDHEAQSDAPGAGPPDAGTAGFSGHFRAEGRRIALALRLCRDSIIHHKRTHAKGPYTIDMNWDEIARNVTATRCPFEHTQKLALNYVVRWHGS
jgi:hypothetical protein